MKKLICILASAALLGACEQKTDVAPAPAQDNAAALTTPPASTETGQKIRKSSVSTAAAPATNSDTKTDAANTLTTAPAPATSSETKTDTTTTTTASPNP